ncbi:hypothetical protein MFRU_064g00430 [Monilinia fructicola]|uniref:Hydrophobin n=1 Tax=Monilinia fructicola TaxID=38448 RepID=A0A5M9JPW3_MONFR|nr:hypothetical protein EYC84_002179 [Monilinia fructicola]KAG4025206.1 hypothetical protein MFRU_064g00430 [Monilinia fructicola]
MQFIATTFIAILSAVAAASPLQSRSGLCSSALDTAQCCDVSVAGVANLNCASPSSTPTSVENFRSICAAGGQQASCCVLPVAGDALVCVAP